MTTRTALTVNAVETGKRGLIASRAIRAAKVLAMAAKVRASLIFTQESGTYLRAQAARTRRPGTADQDRRRSGYGTHYAPPSARSGGRERGNGVLWKRADWRAVRRFVRSVPWDDSATGRLYIPVVLLEDRKSGRRVLAASLHAPTKRADPRGGTRTALNRHVLRLARVADRIGATLVLGGDFNDGDVRPELRGSGLTVAGQHGVDWLLTTGRGDRGRSHDMRGLSDHRAVSARITF